jgi:hypothetical protein
VPYRPLYLIVEHRFERAKAFRRQDQQGYQEAGKGHRVLATISLTVPVVTLIAFLTGNELRFGLGAPEMVVRRKWSSGRRRKAPDGPRRSAHWCVRWRRRYGTAPQVQRAMNLFFGSVLATISLTVPVVTLIAFLTGNDQVGGEKRQMGRAVQHIGASGGEGDMAQHQRGDLASPPGGVRAKKKPAGFDAGRLFN